MPGGGVALVQASRALGAVDTGSDDEAMGVSALEAAYRRCGGWRTPRRAIARTLAQTTALGLRAALPRPPAPGVATRVVRTALRTAVPAAARAIAAEAVIAGATGETESALPGGQKR